MFFDYDFSHLLHVNPKSKDKWSILSSEVNQLFFEWAYNTYNVVLVQLFHCKPVHLPRVHWLTYTDVRMSCVTLRWLLIVGTFRSVIIYWDCLWMSLLDHALTTDVWMVDFALLTLRMSIRTLPASALQVQSFHLIKVLLCSLIVDVPHNLSLKIA